MLQILSEQNSGYAAQETTHTFGVNWGPLGLVNLIKVKKKTMELAVTNKMKTICDVQA